MASVRPAGMSARRESQCTAKPTWRHGSLSHPRNRTARPRRSSPLTRTGGQRLPVEQGKEFTWPMITGTDGKQYDMRIQPAGASWNGHTTTLMEPSKPIAWVTILNTSKNYMLGYVFKREEYPWVQNYMSYNTNGWSGRGIEFATQPF